MSLRGYRLFLAIDTDTGQIIAFLLARGRPQYVQLLEALARRVLGCRLPEVVSASGFTSRASVTMLAATKAGFTLGVARSTPIEARPAVLTPQ